MSRYPYLVNRNGHYYFRIAIPLSLVPIVQRKEFILSLRTKDIQEAKGRSLAVLNLVQGAFLNIATSKVEFDSYLLQHLSRLSFYTERKGHQSLSLVKLSPIETKMIVAEDKISTVFTQYLRECEGNRSKTIALKNAALNLWIKIIGDFPVKEISKAEVRKFKTSLMILPSNFQKKFRGQSLSALKTVTECKTLSVPTVNNYLGHIGSFINWCIKNGHYEKNNPFLGMMLKETETAINKRDPLSQDHLREIFSSPVYKGCKSAKKHDRYISGECIIKDGFYWVPFIALYSGARMQEICQLYKTDIRQIGDIWVFDFNDNGPDKQLKTSSSARKTPIHPKLIELGLLNHLKAKSGQECERLFPDLPMGSNGTYSAVFSKRFSHFLKTLNIKTDKTSFHSFRHTFIDALRNTDVPREVREALVGHLDRRTAHDNYGSAIGVLRLYEGLKKLKYDLEL